ncbi:MAG: hypothetical protein K2U26_10195 [Cyclobacteriaceae bacterium]|nr:hypothetical protein [Cyclobacteriaceae bacterium]
MKWVVLEENPKPDNYIAVMVVNEERSLLLEKKPCSVFMQGEPAMERARMLRDQFKVRSIRVFHWEGHSQIV